ncbi:MAG: NADH-quinone oxidoreductase subunit NuoE [Gammaproteobacteria bacterium]|nr:NADH-quinone oxidoreductase subunit NuoE [Gammaproteobacteria bacterium]
MATSSKPHPAHTLSAAARAEIDRWLTKYPADRRRAATLPALTIVQRENGGYLTPVLLEAVADYLGIPQVAVQEVATFYSLYDLQPVGRHKVYVCNSISCWLRGSEKLLEHIKQRLGVDIGETTADGRCTLKQAECLAACGGAPALMIDDKYHENVTPEKFDALLAGLK